MTEAQDRSVTAKALTNALQLALSVFAIGLPALYAMGRVYQEGYWNSIQLPPLMGYALEDYVYTGFVAIFNAAGRAVGGGTLGYLVIAGLVLTFFACYIVVLDKWLIPTVKRRLRSIGERSNVSEKKPAWLVDLTRLIGIAWTTLTTVSFLFFVLFLCIALPLVGMHKAGKSQAERDKKQLVQHGGRPLKYGTEPVLHYKDDSGVMRASLMLQCSQQWCVIFDNGFFSAVRLDDVIRIDHCPRQAQLKGIVEVCAD